MVQPNRLRFAEIAVDVPSEPGRTFSYHIPDGLNILPGQLVRVPFGARTIQGIVLSLAPGSQVPESETRDISGVVFEEPLLDEVRFSLAGWLSEYYICSLFEACTPMLPAGSRARARTILTLAFGANNAEALTPLQRRTIDYIGKKGSTGLDALLRAVGADASESIPGLMRRGLLHRHYTLPGPSVRHRYRTLANLAPGFSADMDEWLSGRGQRAPKQAAIIEHLRDESSPINITSARREFGASAVKSLIERGWLTTWTVPVDRDPLAGRLFPLARPLTLTVEQSEAATAIHGAFEGPSRLGQVFVIEGVTGSGKTEVYLDAVDCCIQMGKQAIILVPEIALTYQTIERFASRFPGDVAVLHSGLSDGERFDQWWKIKRGRYSVVVGSRSAVFAPIDDLGLIVIDEEHEWTYKQQDSSPRYHAREVSMKLSEYTGALVVSGSASPDVGTYYAGKRGHHRLHRLSERYGDTDDSGKHIVGSLPSVRIVDMREELRSGNHGIFSHDLDSALAECLEAGNQAMLFLNRRGTSSHLRCFSCGYSLRCRSCDVSVTFHRESQRLICHYCGRRRRPPDMCPQCLRHRLRYYGIGTESVANEVAARFPEAGVLRWDRDVATTPSAHEELLTKFRSGDARVLVGTQMIAKGLHFPSVSLVGVVSADVGLAIPDYRAGERAFQLLYQVAGRAGRGNAEGTVIVQTFQPDNYAIQAAAAQDYQAFYEQELSYRRKQNNPPFGRLIRLLYSNTNRAKCESEATEMAENFRRTQREWGLEDVEILGPMPAYPPRLSGRYRWHIILRGATPRTLLEKVRVPKGWSVDVDPVSLT